MADRIGQQLGNYRLTRLLGRGGFAEVYLGEHVFLETTAAIKVLHTQVTQEEIVPFQREARLLASLKHSHIIPVFDFGLDGQTPYLVMAHAPNGTLRTRHARGTRLSVTTVVGYVKQIAEALQYAHGRKVIHRDIKPENMLIAEDGEILLSDFGIALIAQSSRYQSTKDMAGTIAYMAPEQISGHPRSASDQYSLGIVAYEWLCGTLPFHGSFTEIAIKHSITPPQPLREHLSTLSPDVEYVILTALAKQPDQRFPSVSAFAVALEQASQGTPPTESAEPLGTTTTQTDQSVSVPVPTQEKRTGKPTVSRRTILIGTAGAVAIAAVGASILLILQHPSQNQPFTYRGHSSDVNTVAWSPNGKRIASGSADTTVQVWNANDGSDVLTYRGHSYGVAAVAWSPDGKRIASGSADNTVQVWDASDGGNVFTYKGHSNSVYAVAWSPDGKRIASGSADKTVQVWNANDGSKVLVYREHTDEVKEVAWSPDGKRIASASRDHDTVQVWNASDGSNIFTYPNGAFAIAWSPDGKRIASGGGGVRVWNASDGSNVLTYREHSDMVYAVAWSPDGERIASGDVGWTVRVWNASDGRDVVTYDGHGTVWSVAWSPDGKQIASGSTKSVVEVWYLG